MTEDQNLDNQPVDTSGDDDFRAAFGLPPTVADTEEQNDDVQDEQDDEDIDDNDTDEPEEDGDEEQDDGDPNQDEPPADSRTVRIKYNGEDIELTEQEAIEYAQKGKNYDKVHERQVQYQDALDRTARLHGYKDHAEFINHLDEFEQNQISQQRESLQDNENQLIQALVQAGYDESEVRTLIDNNPAIRAGREALKERENAREIEQRRQREAEETRGWEQLLSKYPQLTETIVDGQAPWITPELTSRIQKGISPIDAYEIVHRDSIIADMMKRTQQDVLKQQRLNKRPAVTNRNGKGEFAKQATDEMKDAFAAFGLNPESANKYTK